MQTEYVTACDPAERGAVRRHAQATQDEDPICREPCANNEHFGEPVASALYLASKERAGRAEHWRILSAN